MRGGFRRRLEFVEGLLREMVTPGSRWLDVGCGSGILTQRLAALGATGEAIDGSQAMIRAATGKAPDGGAPAQFAYRHIETVERLDIADNIYDGVLCSSVIEYLDEPADALSEIARVLKPEGKLLISVVNRYSLVRNIQRMMRAASPKGRFPYLDYLDVSRTTFSRSDITNALCTCGIRSDSVCEFDAVLPIWATRFVPAALIFVSATKVEAN